MGQQATIRDKLNAAGLTTQQFARLWRTPTSTLYNLSRRKAPTRCRGWVDVAIQVTSQFPEVRKFLEMERRNDTQSIL